jgi:hypothetical protein
MDDLIAFLNARLDEREAVALAATPGPWFTPPEPGDIAEWSIYGEGWMIASTHHYTSSDMQNDAAKLRKPATVVEHANGNAAHIANNDPQFVLDDIAARRQIVSKAEQARARQGMSAEDEDYWWDMHEVIAILALPFASHPDYREEWRP